MPLAKTAAEGLRASTTRRAARAGALLLVGAVAGAATGCRGEEAGLPGDGAAGDATSADAARDGSVVVDSGEPDPAFAGETVEVRLDRPLHAARQSGSGFLASMSTTRPSDEVMRSVQPRLVRLNPDTSALYDRAIALDARAQMVPGFPKFNGPGSGADYETWARMWEAHLGAVVDRAVAAKQEWQWDIWNEPNWPTFWTGTRAQYLTTWKRAHALIRSKLPDAVIVGPSIAYFDEAFLEEFLLYAKANGVLPTVLSWHELLPDSPSAIATRVQTMRAFMAANAIPISRIQLNEITAASHQLRPGSAIWFMAAIERAGIEAACRSCWWEGFSHTCYNDSLDGLLAGGKPRSVYWAQSAYAAVGGQIVQITPSASFDGVAGADAARGSVRAVVGNHHESRGAVRVRLVGLPAALGLPTGKMVSVRARLIDNSEREAADPPTTLLDQKRAVGTAGVLAIDFPSVDGWAALEIEVLPAD